ncbi:MAG: response regulator transcription factor [Phycisphaerae bacterium]|nr:response regulator transcription factor [Phycisphaerae bacterium]
MKILIADDYGVVREGLKALIEKEEGLDVIGEAENGRQAVELARKLLPDIIIMDITMPDLNGIEAAEIILKANPQVKIIALSMHANKRFVDEMLRAGALGYVLKTYLFDELLRAIHAVSENRHYLSPQITNVLVENYTTSSNRPGPIDDLNERETCILQLLAEGQSTKAIAFQLDISPKTVDACRRQIMDKLNLHSVAELTKYAIRHGLTTLES